MIGEVTNIISGLSDKQADVIIATIGLMSAAFVAGIGLFGSVLTFVLNKRSERKMELRKIKEAQYIEFLGCLAEAKVAVGNEGHVLGMRLSSRIQTIYLVGNKDVQKALHDFLKYITKKSKEQTNPQEQGRLKEQGESKEQEESKEKGQDELYAKLIEAMKKDLYGKREQSLDTIAFTVFDG